jgi:quercetin dioxygenase-like cupin family protein
LKTNDVAGRGPYLAREDKVGCEEDGVLYTNGATAPVVLVNRIEDAHLKIPIPTKVLMPGPKASFFEFCVSRGLCLPPVRFAHDVVYCLIRGRMSVTLGGEHYMAEARDAWSAAPGCEIAFEALEDCTLVEFMSSPHLMTGARLITWGAVLPCKAHIFTHWLDQQSVRMDRVEGAPGLGPLGKDVRQFFKILAPGPSIAAIWISHREGKLAHHVHYHHFLCYLIKGKMREKFGGSQEHFCMPGDIWSTQAGAMHYTEALDDNELLEFKWPAPLLWNGMIHSWENRW